jgi:hypothetical protein
MNWMTIRHRRFLWLPALPLGRSVPTKPQLEQ